MLAADAVVAQLKATSKKRLLQELAHLADKVYGLNSAVVFDALQERELLGPTGMGHGVAVPHARLDGLESVKALFARLDRPIDFESVDRRPVDLVCVLLAPEGAGALHLKALARVSRTLRDDAFCEKLRSTDDPAALFAMLTETATSQAA